MSNIEVLKEQARRHEQKEEWRKALDLYQRAIDRLAEADAPDIGLYNRVGDLYIRVGEIDAAVQSLEQAVDLYVESELPNNAIAVCKKILRNVPDRHEVFLRMGQVRAGQGFLVDARTHFLTYAERMQARGELDEAIRALVEFADAAPDDIEIRLAIADHFESHEREHDAVEQLVAGYAAAVRQNLDDKVESIRERLASLRPGADPDALVAELLVAEDPDADEEEDGDAWDFGDTRPLDEGPTASDAPRESAVEEARAEPAAGEVDAAAAPAEVDETVRDVPVDEALDQMGPDVTEYVRPAATGNPLEGMDVVDEALDDDEDLDADLPFLHVPGEEAEDGGTEGGEGEDDGPPAYHGTLEAPTDDVVAPWSEPDATTAAGQWDESATPRSGTAAEPETIPTPASESPPEPSDPLELRQRAVEEAHRSGDEAAVVAAYVALGHELRRSGAEPRAQAVFRQALQVDPENAEARDALAAGAPDRRPVAEVASSEDYVDLGALILGDDEEKTTRFVVAYEEPSGDEEADFVKMLSQFKAKVAENVDAEDVKAHHDLGTAYKEMGLLDEAVEEFQAALRASAEHLPTYELLGQTFLERGAPETAVRVLSRALEVPCDVEDELLGIYYFLGRSHEDCGNKDDAREFYERVFSLDINFADVTERLRALR